MTNRNHKKVESEEGPSGRYIPMHLWKLIDDIWQRGLKEEELFNKNGDYDQLKEVIKAGMTPFIFSAV